MGKPLDIAALGSSSLWSTGLGDGGHSFAQNLLGNVAVGVKRVPKLPQQPENRRPWLHRRAHDQAARKAPGPVSRLDTHPLSCSLTLLKFPEDAFRLLVGPVHVIIQN